MYEALDGVRLQTEKERRERHKPTRRNDRPDVRIPRRVNRRYGVKIGAGRTTSGFANKIDLNRRDARTAEARSAGTLGRPGERNRVAIRVAAITPRTLRKNQLLIGTPPRETDGIV